MTSAVETLSQDVRFALRAMRRTPGFTAVAVLSLALGIGANTTIFTPINATLLAAIPVERPPELVVAYTTDPVRSFGGLGGLLPMSQPNFKDFRQQNHYLLDMAAYSPIPISLVTTGDPQPGVAELVTGNGVSIASPDRRQRCRVRFSC